MRGWDELRKSELYGVASLVSLMLVAQTRPQVIIQRTLVAYLGMFFLLNAMQHCSVGRMRQRPLSPLSLFLFSHVIAGRRIHKPAAVYAPKKIPR
jgi:hypothetical protein